MEKRIYELTVVMSVKKSEKEIKSVVEALLEKVGGRLVDFNFWGKKDLVYPIKKQSSALFGFFEIELDPAKVTDLTNRLRMNDDVWRHMLVSGPEVSAKSRSASGGKVAEIAKKSTKKVVKLEKKAKK